MNKMLEARIDALITQDPNKLVILREGLDIHCWNMLHYLPEFFKKEGVVLTGDMNKDKIIVNGLKEKYKDIRQKYKSATFGLQYGCSAHGLVKVFGFTEEEAKSIYDGYHNLYKVTDEYKKQKLYEAGTRGYCVLAYDNKLKTPALQASILGSSVTPQRVSDEMRTAGNAMIQSYGMLTSFAMLRLWKDIIENNMLDKVRIVNQIHDAIYCMCRNDWNTLEWLNRHLVSAMVNEKDDVLCTAEDTTGIGLAADMMIYYPSWAHELELPNNIEIPELKKLIKSYKETLNA